MKLTWEDAQTFLSVAESRSFSQAARILQVGQPTISRRIRSLEERVGQQLFMRGKYGAQLTPVAERLLPSAIQMAKWATEFERAMTDATDAVDGLIKIACPPGVAVEQLAPFSAWLALHEPGIRLEVLSSIEHVDLTRGAAEIAIRTQYPTEPELIALHEFSSKPGVYGSRKYVSALAQPCTWQELDWVTWSQKYQHLAPRPMLEKAIKDFKPVLASDDYLVQKAAVRSGIGVMICDPPRADDPFPLVKVDVGVELPSSKFYLVCARSMQHASLVTRVVELLVENFAQSVHTEKKED